MKEIFTFENVRWFIGMLIPSVISLYTLHKTNAIQAGFMELMYLDSGNDPRRNKSAHEKFLFNHVYWEDECGNILLTLIYQGESYILIHSCKLFVNTLESDYSGESDLLLDCHGENNNRYCVPITWQHVNNRSELNIRIEVKLVNSRRYKYREIVDILLSEKFSPDVNGKRRGWEVKQWNYYPVKKWG